MGFINGGFKEFVRSAENEKRKATRVFLLCQLFLVIKIKEKGVLSLCYQNTANLMDRAPSAKWEI